MWPSKELWPSKGLRPIELIMVHMCMCQPTKPELFGNMLSQPNAALPFLSGAPLLIPLLPLPLLLLLPPPLLVKVVSAGK